MALDVRSHHVMEWIDVEPVWLLCPELADVFEGREALQGLEALGEVVGVEEGFQVVAQPIVAVVVVSAHCGFLERAIRSLDLAVRPRVVGLGQAMLDVVPGAGQFEGVSAEISPLSIATLMSGAPDPLAPGVVKWVPLSVSTVCIS